MEEIFLLYANCIIIGEINKLSKQIKGEEAKLEARRQKQKKIRNQMVGGSTYTTTMVTSSGIVPSMIVGNVPPCIDVVK